mmetsp:Transcript_20468/g.51846  ORF Transcript_20468/g.51846 Transcript_20468/m.51846 type:complete len:183 (-) Transcript_20468:269-817(-)
MPRPQPLSSVTEGCCCILSKDPSILEYFLFELAYWSAEEEAVCVGCDPKILAKCKQFQSLDNPRLLRRMQIYHLSDNGRVQNFLSHTHVKEHDPALITISNARHASSSQLAKTAALAADCGEFRATVNRSNLVVLGVVVGDNFMENEAQVLFRNIPALFFVEEGSDGCLSCLRLPSPDMLVA